MVQHAWGVVSCVFLITRWQILHSILLCKGQVFRGGELRRIEQDVDFQQRYVESPTVPNSNG
ncbi:MAG: hypothetical protein GY758_24745 [Fuerstiella sp.]|nr:hypothetical protein [Fuerstiella sp.]MCP4784422.1 hypothetical protein [Fuerstiella sp.]